MGRMAGGVLRGTGGSAGLPMAVRLELFGGTGRTFWRGGEGCQRVAAGWSAAGWG